MKTKLSNLVLMFVIVSIVGDFCNVNMLFGQQMTVVAQKKKEIIFKIGDGTNWGDSFGGFDLFSDDTFYVKGISDSSSNRNHYVALLNFDSMVWKKKIFEGTASFSGDASTYTSGAETLLYATTLNGVVSYDRTGTVVNNILVTGNKGKMVQRSDSNKLMVMKIVGSNAMAYNYSVDGTLLDSVLVEKNVLFIQSRFFEKTSQSWFIGFGLSNTKTSIVKLTSNGVAWQKQFLKTDRTWITADANRVYAVSDSFATDYSYRSIVKAYDHNGNEMWSKLYVQSNGNNVTHSNNIGIYPDGGCTIIGVVASDPSYYAASFDMNGQFLWDKSFTDLDSEFGALNWNSKKELIIGGTHGLSSHITSYSIEGVTLGVDDPPVPANVPSVFVLNQNYPNPFNPSTKISYSLPVGTQVQLVVYNQLGQVVAELANGFESAGNHEVTFNGSNMTSGVYIARLIVSGNAPLTKKMLMIK